MRRSLAGKVVGVVLVPFVVVACSASSSTHEAHGSGASSTSSSASNESGEVSADAMFAQMMIPHHEQAVVMAGLAAQRASNPVIRGLAARIGTAQAPEIATMRGWLSAWGVPETTGETHAGHAGHGGMKGMLSEEQLAALTAANGQEFDALFAEAMIVHHQGAVAMAQDVLRSGSDPRVTALAASIVASQTQEIAELRAFLADPR